MKKADNNKKIKIILSVIIVLTLAFIWIHSSMGQEESGEESGFVYRLLCPFFEIFMGEGNVTEHFIRKLAHFTEFCALGTEVMLYLYMVLKLSKPLNMANSWVFGTMCALIDETIQIFSGRGPAIADVWLDSAGCFTGVIIITCVIIIYERKKDKKNRTPGFE